MAKTFQLGQADLIPLGEGRNFEVDGKQIAVFRTRAGGLYASQARCPHRQGPLADGLVGPASVVCPLHEWQFDLATGKTENGTCGIEVYPVSIDENGLVSVDMPG